MYSFTNSANAVILNDGTGDKPLPKNAYELKAEGDWLVVRRVNANSNLLNINYAEISAPVVTSAQDAVDQLTAYFFSAASGGGNVADGGSNQDILRWENTGWIPDAVVKLYAAVAGLGGSTFKQFQRVLNGFTQSFGFGEVSGASTSAAVVNRSNSGSAFNSLSAGEAAATIFSRNSGGQSSTLNFSPSAGAQFQTVGFQPTTTLTTANDDSHDITTQMMTVVVASNDYPNQKSRTENLPASPLNRQTVVVINDGDGVVIVNGNGKEINVANYVDYLSTRGAVGVYQYNGTHWIMQQQGKRQFNAKYIAGANAVANTVTAGYTPSIGILNLSYIYVRLDGGATVFPTIDIPILGLVGYTLNNSIVQVPNYLLEVQEAQAIEVTVTGAADAQFDFVCIFEFTPL